MPRKLSYANVMSTLAVVLALGGGTTAIAISGKVGAKDLAKVNVRQVGSPPNVQTVDVKASCKKGERLIGGGAEITDSADLTVSKPEGNGWRAGGLGPTAENSGMAYALCLSK